jgi:membrane-associated phospholipid phosphatase
MNAKFSPAARFLLAALLFILLEIALVMFVDRPLSDYLRAVDVKHHAIIDFFRSWTNLGKSQWYLWPSGLGMLVSFALSYRRRIPERQRREWRYVGRVLGFFFVCVALSGIATDILKPMIGRARPVALLREGLYGFQPFSLPTAHDVFNSMPSGHTTTAFAVAFALMALQPRYARWLIAFAVAIGLSRIMVNAHYLSDVLAGAVVGTLTTLALRKLFRRRGWLMVNFPQK